MQRLQRFKWIPMLLRAWNEARERTEAARTDAEATGAANPDPPKTRARSTKQTRTSAKPTGALAHHTAKRRRVRRLKRQNAAVSNGRRLPVRRIDRADYHAVLRELREAKKQLGQLDSIRSQLDELQLWFEQRMAAQSGSGVNRMQDFSPAQGQRPGTRAANVNPYGPRPYASPSQGPGRPAPALSPPGIGAEQKPPATEADPAARKDTSD